MIIRFIELAAVAFVIWGFANEEKFIEFEKKIYKIWKDGTK